MGERWGGDLLILSWSGHRFMALSTLSGDEASQMNYYYHRVYSITTQCPLLQYDFFPETDSLQL